MYLPADLCEGAGLDPEHLFAGRSSPALQHVSAQVAARAQVPLLSCSQSSFSPSVCVEASCERFAYFPSQHYCLWKRFNWPVADGLVPGLQAALDEARAAVRQSGSSVDPVTSPLMLSTVAAGLYLKALASSNFDPYSPQLAQGGYSPLRHQLAVKWHLFRSTF